MYIWSKNKLAELDEYYFEHNFARCMKKETFFFNLNIFKWFLPMLRFADHTNMEDFKKLCNKMMMIVSLME